MIVKEHQEDLLTFTMDRDELETILIQATINKDKVRKDPSAYYDEAKDKENIKEYYAGIDFSQLTDKALYEELHDLLERTHTRQVKYNPTLYLYKWVDLHENGSLKSIYSGQSRDPEEVIVNDYEIAAQRKEALAQITARFGREDADREAAITELESSLRFNCEHVVPQSWFSKKEPMKGDLHHLFTCEPVCNSIRSNNPYFDFPDYEPEHRGITEGCGKSEGKKFEPEYAKGAVSRATMYFLLRYPNKIDLKKIDIQLLLDWHKASPVSRYEKHRNNAIYEIQGDRNPFIDFPEQAERIDFFEA